MASQYDLMKPVTSSMFSRAGYDETKWELLLEFRSTKEARRYKNVSPEVADEALSAESLGKWWNKVVKGNSAWEYETMEAEPLTVPPPKSEPKRAMPWDSEMGLTDADLDRIAPDPNIVQTVVTQVQSGKIVSDESGTRLEPFGPEDVLTSPVTVKAPVFDATDEDLPDWAIVAPQEQPQTAITNIPQVQILDPWQPPKTATEAITLLDSRKNEIAAIIRQNTEIGLAALAIRVSDAATYTPASEQLTALTAKKTGTVKLLDPFREILLRSYQDAGAQVKSAVEPIDRAINHVKSQILTWQTAEERKRQEAIRLERERADALARQQQQQMSEQLTLQEVAEAIEAGDTAKAEELVANPIEVPLPHAQPTFIPPAAPKVSGQSVVKKWKVSEQGLETDEGYIASLVVLLNEVKADRYDVKIAASHLLWDLPKLNDLASGLGSAFAVPGLRVEETSTLRVGAGRKKKG